MLTPSKVHHSQCKTDCMQYVPERFGVLSWNVYKKNRLTDRFRTFLKASLDKDVMFMLFQEAHFVSGEDCVLESFSFEAAANLEMEQGYYGVLTASRSAATEAKAFLSEEKEVIVGTHKSLLLSTYAFRDGRELLVVNMHAINFRENGAYEREKQRLLSYLSSYSGPILLAGDFNTWSLSRLALLLKTTEALGLQKVPFSSDEGVKSFLGNPLDMIFYRGLVLHHYEVLDDGGISDHRPLLASFSLSAQEEDLISL
jgi:endonuclease/exonuclease/phosphatase family metal-dependent hydrolase